MGVFKRCCDVPSCCCIGNINVDFAVPDTTGPASWGSYSWSPSSPTSSVMSFDSGLGEQICTNIYVAPKYRLCNDDTATTPNETLDIVGLYNYKTLRLNRNMRLRFFALTSSGGNYTWNTFNGNETWKSNVIVTDLQVTVKKSATKVRTSMSFQAIYELIRYPGVSAVGTASNTNSCTTAVTLNYTTDYSTFVCNQFASLGRCYDSSACAFQQTVFQGYYTTSGAFDSGWVDGTCLTLPRKGSSRSTWSEYYNFTSSTPNLCRMPSGVTESNTDTDVCGTNRTCSYTYPSSVESYFCDHLLTFTDCRFVDLPPDGGTP